MVQKNASPRRSLIVIKRLCLFAFPLIVGCSSPPNDAPVVDSVGDCVDGRPCSPAIVDVVVRTKASLVQIAARPDTDAFALTGEVSIPVPPYEPPAEPHPPTLADNGDTDEVANETAVPSASTPPDPLWTGR